jgi:acetyl esterase/lipase
MNRQEILLWPQGAPGALGQSEEDRPTLTQYPSTNDASRQGAVVIFPGGGYGGLADYEGHDYALYLNRLGLHAFVVKYRLGSAGYRHPAMLEDAARAVQMVRENAEEWNVDPNRVAVMGSSAGGHLAATLMTHWSQGKPNHADPLERLSSRPDLGILCYPVISMGEISHEGSRLNLLGENPPKKLIDDLSNEKQVNEQTPPCFIFHTVEDQMVPVENAIEFAQALQRNKVSYELHLYQKGDHGVALGGSAETLDDVHPWVKELARWLTERGWIG